MKRGYTKDREVFGRYEVKKHPGGGFTVFDMQSTSKRIRREGLYIPSDEKIVEKYKTYRANGQRTLSSTLFGFIRMRAIPVIGKPSAAEGRKLLGLPEREREDLVTREEILEAIKSYWSESEVEKYMAGKPVSPEYQNRFTVGEGIKGFSKKFRRQFDAAHYKFGNGRGKEKKDKTGIEILMEEVSPGLYQGITLRRHYYHMVDREKLREELLDRFSQGLPINHNYLRHSDNLDEQRLWREVMLLDKNEGIVPQGFTKKVMDLTGLSKKDIIVQREAFMRNGLIAEELTSLVLEWAPILRVEIPGFPLEFDEPILSDQENRTFVCQNGKYEEVIADRRVVNKAIEVKQGNYRFLNKDLDYFLNRYTPGKNKWVSGEVMGGSLVVFNQRKDFYSQVTPELEEAGIVVLGYEGVSSCLEQVIDGIKAKFSVDCRAVRPRVEDLHSLLGLHTEISLNPHTVLSPIATKYQYALDLLRALSGLGQEVKLR